MRFSRTSLSLAILTTLSTASFAEDVSEQNTQIGQTSVKLNTLVVEAKQEDAVGNTTYTQEKLQQAANPQKSITDFLKRHTNIQFDRDSQRAGDQASLAPDKISINGAPSYDNKFVINGVNTSNTFDPVGELADSNYQGMPSNAQTANINTDLLCELTVIDSNASAEYGQFLGGVISAKTCAPSTDVGKIHGKISFDYTNDSWARFNYINQDEEAKFEDDQDLSRQREYTTQGLSGHLYGRLNDEWALNLAVAKRQSRIPVLSGFAEGDKVPTVQNNDSIGLTAYFNPSEAHQFQFGVEHYDYNKDGYYKNVIHSDYETQTITNSAFINARHRFDDFQIEQNLSYRQSSLERELKRNSSTLWYYAEGSKDWRPDVTHGDSLTEGGFGGDLTNEQDTLAYQITAKLNPYQLADTQHHIKLGASYEHNEGFWERPEDMALYTTRSNLGTAQCAAGDAYCDEADLQYRPNKNTPFTTWQGQYSRYGVIYGAGKHTVRQDQGGLFIEDDIHWKNLRTRIGVRADYDSLASNLNVAPRFNIEYKPFSNDALRLTAGINRYYGNTFLISELDEKIYSHQGTLTRATKYDSAWNSDNNYGWTLSPTNSTAGVRANDLDTPYSDERVFAINSEWNNVNLGLKWVNREYKDRLWETRVMKLNQNNVEVLDYRTYSNVDGGSADTLSLNLANIKSLEWLNADHHFNLGVSYHDNETLRGSYKDVDNADRNNQIYYQGQILTTSLLPTKESPVTARLSWDIQGKNQPFQISNFFNYRSKHTNFVKTDQVHTIATGTELPIYEDKNFPSRFTWDMRASYQWQLDKTQSVTLGLTSTNVLNKKNYTVDSKGVEYSDEGRRFVADVTYKF